MTMLNHRFNSGKAYDVTYATKSDQRRAAKLGIVCVSILGLASYLYLGCAPVSRNHRALMGEYSHNDPVQAHRLYIDSLQDKKKNLPRRAKSMSMENLQDELAYFMNVPDCMLKTEREKRLVKDALLLCGKLMAEKQQLKIQTGKRVSTLNSTDVGTTTYRYETSDDMRMKAQQFQQIGENIASSREVTIYGMIFYILQAPAVTNEEIERYTKFPTPEKIKQTDLIVKYFEKTETNNRTKKDDKNSSENLIREIEANKGGTGAFTFYLDDWRIALNFYVEHRGKHICVVQKQARAFHKARKEGSRWIFGESYLKPIFGVQSGCEATGIYIKNPESEYTQKRFLLTHVGGSRLKPFNVIFGSNATTLVNGDGFFENSTGKWLQQKMDGSPKTEVCDKSGPLKFVVKRFTL